jgi:hypothetical protein
MRLTGLHARKVETIHDALAKLQAGKLDMEGNRQLQIMVSQLQGGAMPLIQGSLKMPEFMKQPPKATK